MLNQNKIARRTELSDVISKSIVPELNIYNQAYLILDRPLLETKSYHSPTTTEIPLIFLIEGDYKGHILCLIDLDKKKVNENSFHFFQSLYIESMNIALGKFLTNLEYNGDLLITLSSPEIYPSNPRLQELSGQFKNTKMFSWSYKLVSQIQEFDCRINIFLEK